MKYVTFSEKKYNGGGIVRNSERTMYCVVTVDIHQTHTLHQTAVEHVYTDALLSGSGKYSRQEFSDAIHLLGGSIDVSIANSCITFSVKSTDVNADKVLSLFKTMIEKPKFSSKEIKRIHTQVRNELAEYEENARSLAYDNFINKLYNKADRRHTDAPKTVAKEVLSVTSKDLHELHKKVRAAFWTVTVGSNLPIIDMVKRTINSCQTNSDLLNNIAEHSQKRQKAHIALQNIPSKQNIEFSIGTTLPLTLNHPDFLPFVFGLNVLGKWGGFTGRLMSTVREKEGLTYSIYARTETTNAKEMGYWRIMTFFAPDKSLEGLQSTIREIKNIHANGITNSEFERFKIILKTQQALLSDSLPRSIDELHTYFRAGFDLREIELFKKKSHSVTKKQVNDALRKYLSPETLVISGAGPIKKVKTSILKLSK